MEPYSATEMKELESHNNLDASQMHLLSEWSSTQELHAMWLQADQGGQGPGVGQGSATKKNQENVCVCGGGSSLTTTTIS